MSPKPLKHPKLKVSSKFFTRKFRTYVTIYIYELMFINTKCKARLFVQ